MIVVIDYEKEFQDYIGVWMKRAGLGPNMYQVVDDHIDEIYEEWMHTPLENFGGKMPHHFFDEIDSAESCFKMIKKYIEVDIAVPGPLLSRMVVLKDEGYPLLLETLKNTADTESDALKTFAVELITEMEAEHPLDAYIETIRSSEYSGDAVEAMVEVLKNQAPEVKLKVIAAYLDTPYEFAKDTFLDILSELMFDYDAYKYIYENFVYEPSKSGMYAHMLSKVGIADCTDVLEQRLSDPDIGYINFCRVKEALEELGGETSVERDFAGDPDYEYMVNMAEEEENPSEDEEDDEDEDLEDEDLDE